MADSEVGNGDIFVYTLETPSWNNKIFSRSVSFCHTFYQRATVGFEYDRNYSLIVWNS